MGRKRTREPTPENVPRRTRRRIIYSSSEDENIIDIPLSPERPASHSALSRSVSSSRVRHSVSPTAFPRSTASSRVRQKSPQNVTPRRKSQPRRRLEIPRVPSPTVIIHREASPSSPPGSPIPEMAGTSTENPVCSEDLELDEDILQLLGDPPKDDTPLGPAIHKDVAKRWQDILAKGLPKDVKDKILEQYLVPSNCDLLQASALNPEAKVALTEAMVRRDASLMHKQKQLGLALSAMARVMQMVIANETSKKKLFKPISDACRILCDSHYIETKTRRNLVLSSINTSLKETLIESTRDAKLLFGENVSEKLKAAKAIQRSGESLKPPQKFTKSNFYARNSKNPRPNFKPVYRRAENKQTGADTGGGGAGAGRAARAPPPRQTRSGAPQKQSDRDRSPPPRRNYYRR